MGVHWYRQFIKISNFKTNVTKQTPNTTVDGELDRTAMLDTNLNYTRIPFKSINTYVKIYMQLVTMASCIPTTRTQTF